jgi:hypothetical protein
MASSHPNAPAIRAPDSVAADNAATSFDRGVAYLSVPVDARPIVCRNRRGLM